MPIDPGSLVLWWTGSDVGVLCILARSQHEYLFQKTIEGASHENWKSTAFTNKTSNHADKGMPVFHSQKWCNLILLWKCRVACYVKVEFISGFISITYGWPNGWFCYVSKVWLTEGKKSLDPASCIENSSKELSPPYTPGSAILSKCL